MEPLPPRPVSTSTFCAFTTNVHIQHIYCIIGLYKSPGEPVEIDFRIRTLSNAHLSTGSIEATT